jgi:Flp pilus assembly protein CpaB
MAKGMARSKRRIDIRVGVGALLVMGGAVGTVSLVSAMDATSPYLTVVRDLVDGDIITPEDIAVVDIHTRQGSLPYLGAEYREVLAGNQVTQPLTAGELIPPSALASPRATDSTTITVALGINGAPWLRPGTRVDVWMSPAADQGLYGPPRVVASGAVVVGIRGEEGFAADPSTVSIDVRVVRRDAPAIIGALANNFPLALTPLHQGQDQ